MRPLTVVVVVAVLGASLLLAIGSIIVITTLRRRDRRLMQRYGLGGNLAAYHRSRLSATENNYAHIPSPNAALRTKGRPASIPALWSAIPSGEYIQPEGSAQSHPEIRLVTPDAKRRKSLRASLYGHSSHVPRTRRNRRIEKTISLKQTPGSPLSAITEFTDSIDEPVVADSSTEHTQTDIPANLDESQSPVKWPLPVAKTTFSHENTMQRQNSSNDRPKCKRSVSMGSTISNAPDGPLPPLPVFNMYKHHRSHGWRASTASIDTVDSSVLGTVMSSPSQAGTDLTIPTLNSDMQTFDFGFNDSRASARLGVPPGRQTLAGYCAGKSGITSIRPSVEYNAGRNISTVSAQQESLQTIDARNWNPGLESGSHWGSYSASATRRHSLQDYGSFLSKRSQYNQLVDLAERGSPRRRPASVASSNPYQWDLKPAFSSMRHSAGSANSSRRGHRRQNCVRITNLPSVEVRNSKVEQMPEVAEEQLETPTAPKVNIPGLELLEANQTVLRARDSLVDVKGSPSPMQNRPILLPTRLKRPVYWRTSTSSSGIPRSDSDVFSTAQPSPTSPSIFQSTRQLPLSQTSSTNIKMNSNTPPRYHSPPLPSPIDAGQPRRSLVKGPRNLLASSRPSRTASPTPAGQKHTQKKTTDDLRKSVMMLRSMNSEGRLLDQSSHTYRNIGTSDDDTSSKHPTMDNLSLSPIDPRPSVAFGPSRNKMGVEVSPSVMSMGATSIWEDASVRADSPEPDLPTPEPERVGSRPRTPQMKIPYPDPEAYENMVSHSKAFKDRKYKSSQGKGLGIVGPEGRVIGTPGSLYDGDGFLKD